MPETRNINKQVEPHLTPEAKAFYCTTVEKRDIQDGSEPRCILMNVYEEQVGESDLQRFATMLNHSLPHVVHGVQSQCVEMQVSKSHYLLMAFPYSVLPTEQLKKFIEVTPQHA